MRSCAVYLSREDAREVGEERCHVVGIQEDTYAAGVDMLICGAARWPMPMRREAPEAFSAEPFIAPSSFTALPTVPPAPA